MRKFTRTELAIAGAVLYSCEGTKVRIDKRRKNKTFYWVIEFTNSNPKLVELFVTFLRKIIKIEIPRLKGQLFIYNDLPRTKLEKYWSKVSGIPVPNFNKTIILVAKNRKYTPNPLGTFKIRYHSKESVKKLLKLIDSII